MNPNGSKKYRYLGIFSNMFKFQAKGIFSANQFHAAGHLYDDKPRKIEGKQRMVTTDRREINIFISDGIAYPLVRCLTNKYMESYPKYSLPQMDSGRHRI